MRLRIHRIKSFSSCYLSPSPSLNTMDWVGSCGFVHLSSCQLCVEHRATDTCQLAAGCVYGVLKPEGCGNVLGGRHDWKHCCSRKDKKCAVDPLQKCSSAAIHRRVQTCGRFVGLLQPELPVGRGVGSISADLSGRGGKIPTT